MFRCAKCQENIPDSPHIVSTGFRRDDAGKALHQRLGEAYLCAKCALKYRNSLKETTETAGGYLFTFLLRP